MSSAGDGGSSGSIALPAVAEPVADADAPAVPIVPAAPQTTATADPRPEASFPATPKTAGAEAPTPTAPATGKAAEVATDTDKQGTSDQQPSPDGGRAPEAPAPARTIPTPAAPSGVPAVSVPTTSTSSAPNVAFSSPAPAAAPLPSAALEATLRMAGENGFTRARVTLRPAQLGGVEVFLREGSAGLTATVVAETPQAAQMLESSTTELQRRLAAQGLELSSLQNSVGGESAGAAHGGRDREGGAGTTGGARGASTEAVAPAEKTQTIDLGGGVLVDVLA
jgi:flagellar hook-length control protein FliK